MRMHWIITLQQPAGAAGFTTSTFSGWHDLEPGETRGSVFAALFEGQAALMRRPPGAPGLPNVLFFALEPDELRS